MSSYAPTDWVDGVTPVNAANLDKLEAGVAGAVQKPAGLASGEFPVWNGTAWVRSTSPTVYVGPLAVSYSAPLYSPAFMTAAAGDTQPRIVIFNDGRIDFGSGAGSQDVRLYRVAADVLKTDDAFQFYGGNTFGHFVQDVGSLYLRGDARINFGAADDTNLYRYAAGYLATDGQLYFRGGSNSYLAFVWPGEQARFFIGPDGNLNWGSGVGAQDTNFYRGAAGRLRTDGSFWASGDVEAGFGGTLGSTAFVAYASGDSNWRFYVDNGGRISWGPGNAPGDVSLYRAYAGALYVDGQMSANAPSSGATSFAALYPGVSNFPFYISGAGAMSWGPGTAPADTNLYRNGVAWLQTDGILTIGGDFGARWNTAYQVKAGLVASAYPGLTFGNAQDTNLYRASADTLKTDDSLEVGGTLKVGGVLVGTVGIGTSLPGSPTDGLEYILVDSLTAPTYSWRFRYVSGISDAYKWVFLGGVPALSEVPTSENYSSASYGNLATVGPQITLPRAGIFQIEIGCRLFTGSGGSYMSYAIGATAAVDADSINMDQAGGTIPYGSRPAVKTISAASTAIVAKYRTSGISGNFLHRWMRIVPVRVS